MCEIGISPNGKVFDAAWAYESGLISFEEMEEAIQRKDTHDANFPAVAGTTYDDLPSDDESWRRSIFD